MDNYQSFSETMNRVLNKAIQKEMTPRVLDSEVILYRMELHVISAVGDHTGINLTGLAELLGVTKSAVSQKVKILEKKGYLVISKKENNNKEIQFKLTQKGENIFCGHQEFHQQLNNKIKEFVGNIDESDMEKFTNILKFFEHHFESL